MKLCETCIQLNEVLKGENITVGVGAVTTSYDLVIERKDNGRKRSETVTSDGAGLIILATTADFYTNGNTYIVRSGDGCDPLEMENPCDALDVSECSEFCIYETCAA